MNKMNKLFFSIVIGVIALAIANSIHSDWSVNKLYLFGIIVAIITFCLTLLIGGRK
jgi:uncharacterized membrane protein YeaQ/YmgE (transglycosylase-associated protein family)